MKKKTRKICEDSLPHCHWSMKNKRTGKRAQNVFESSAMSLQLLCSCTWNRIFSRFTQSKWATMTSSRWKKETRLNVKRVELDHVNWWREKETVERDRWFFDINTNTVLMDHRMIKETFVSRSISKSWELRRFHRKGDTNWYQVHGKTKRQEQPWNIHWITCKRIILCVLLVTL